MLLISQRLVENSYNSKESMEEISIKCQKPHLNRNGGYNRPLVYNDLSSYNVPVFQSHEKWIKALERPCSGP